MPCAIHDCRIGLVVALLACIFSAPAPAQSDPASAIAAAITAGEADGIHGMVMLRGGERVIDAASSELDEKGLDIRSATKSITALLIGIAVDRGELSSVEEPIDQWLPGYAKHFERDAVKRAITIADLLTMRSGLECNDWDPASPGHEDRMYRKRDWIDFWIRQDIVAEPGEVFSYCTGNVIALGRILANATGRSVAEFASAHLFEPLGIEHAQWETWNRKRDIDSGGHLRLHPRDLAKIGQLVASRGMHDGEQVVSAAWIEGMTTEHVAIPNQQQRYGYLWWLDATTRPELPRTRLQMAWGNGGNYLIVLPELDTVIAFAGERYNRPDQMEPLAWVGRGILPTLGSGED
ncbi:MAG: serine hydrolase [Pseudomonadota bacterium]